MPRKLFQVQVELDVNSVSCPGVWLCPCGKVSLQIYMLDSCVQTISVEPIFPLNIQEKFLFYKIFDQAQRLSDLQRLLGKESLYVELIQWNNTEIGNVLATFITSLSDVLFPATIDGVYAGNDVDLLMEPSSTFPGIIAPKIEISTKTTIEETLCTQQHKKCSAFVVNPKTVASNVKTRPPCMRQRKVCHSLGYHKARKYRNGGKEKTKPPFQYRRADDHLLLRTPKGLDRRDSICKCRCNDAAGWQLAPRTFTDLTENFLQNYSKDGSSGKLCPQTSCTCKKGHSNRTCAVCAKYNNVFENVQCFADNQQKMSSGRTCKCRCRSVPLRKIELVEVPPPPLLCKKCERHHQRNNNSFVGDGGGGNVSRICHCSPHSTTETIHRKLSADTSGGGGSAESSYYHQSPTISVADSCVCASTPKIYTTGRFQRKFYDSLERFYQNLYRRVQERSKNVESLCIC